MREVADVSTHLNVLDRAIPRLPAEVLVHHEPHARRRAVVDDALAGFVGRRQRLLTDDVDAARRRERAHLLVGLRRRDDVHEVGTLAVEHLLPVVVEARDAVLRHQRPRALLGAVVDRDDLDFRDPGPRLVLERREVARADPDAAQSAWFASCGLSADDNQPVLVRAAGRHPERDLLPARLHRGDGAASSARRRCADRTS